MERYTSPGKPCPNVPGIGETVRVLRTGGPKVFFYQLRRQIFRRDIQIGLFINMEAEKPLAPIGCHVKYYVRPATKEDMNEVMEKAKAETSQSVQLLIHRGWLYDCGFRNWYIARIDGTDEICYMQCIIRPEDNGLIARSFQNWFPQQKEGEALLEGAYTFEKFRGNGIFAAVMNDICEINRRKGFKRIKTYIDKDNIASLKGVDRIGFKKFEEVKSLVLLFCTRRKSGKAI